MLIVCFIVKCNFHSSVSLEWPKYSYQLIMNKDVMNLVHILFNARIPVSFLIRLFTDICDLLHIACYFNCHYLLVLHIPVEDWHRRIWKPWGTTSGGFVCFLHPFPGNYTTSEELIWFYVSNLIVLLVACNFPRL
jgi:hypothetical protein